MSIACIKGASYCNGCGACNEKYHTVGECAVCGDLIYSDDERYDIDGEVLIHEACLREWAEQYLVRS